eukprot:SAG11_NODE_22051_length_413_cov_0.805732_2_plen_54_part_00
MFFLISGMAFFKQPFSGLYLPFTVFAGMVHVFAGHRIRPTQSTLQFAANRTGT